MNLSLPNYFLADLPAEAVLTADMLVEACQTLRRNREQYLCGRSTENLVRVFAGLGERWLMEDYPFRRMAIELGPKQTGFSKATLEAGLDAFFGELTAENFRSLLIQELGHAGRLDEMAAAKVEERGGRAALARGPELMVHITAGNLPNPAFMSIILGFLVRSAQVVKCASGATFLPRLFAHSIYEMEPKLGACLEVGAWTGGNFALENALFGEADCVTATGTDETIQSIRQRAPVRARFLAYGEQVSFGYATREVLSADRADDIIASAAEDIVAWDQLGCLSPHVIYVERGGAVGPEQFAERLARELARKEEVQPRGALSAAEAAAVSTRRGFYEIRAAHSPDTRYWCSQGSTAWTVIYEADARFQLSSLNRFIHVKSVSEPAEALRGADAVRGKVSTVGIGADGRRAAELAHELARWGVRRVCPLGRMQKPPLTWRHDGRPPLGDLVSWTDWEMEVGY